MAKYSNLWALFYFQDKRTLNGIDEHGNPYSVEKDRQRKMNKMLNLESIDEFFLPQHFVGHTLYDEENKYPHQIMKTLLIFQGGTMIRKWTLWEYFLDFPLRQLMGVVSHPELEVIKGRLQRKQQLAFGQSKLLSDLLAQHNILHHRNAFKFFTQKNTA